MGRRRKNNNQPAPQRHQQQQQHQHQPRPQLITQVPADAKFSFLPRLVEYEQSHMERLMSEADDFLTNNWNQWQSDANFKKNQGGFGLLVRNKCLESACSAYQRFMNGVYAYTADKRKKQQLRIPLAPAPGTITLAVPGSVYGPSYHPEALPGSHTTFFDCPIRFAFHGTTAASISQINCKGFDPTKRKAQAYGPGEYFARTPHFASYYNHKEPQMLVVAIIMSHDHVIAPNSEILVVNNPFAVEAENENMVCYAVPLGILVYGDLNCREEFFRCQDPPPPPPPVSTKRQKLSLYARQKTTRSHNTVQYSVESDSDYVDSDSD